MILLRVSGTPSLAPLGRTVKSDRQQLFGTSNRSVEDENKKSVPRFVQGRQASLDRRI